MIFQPKKRFGQNFLVSKHHLNLLEKKLANFLEQIKPDAIIEIGPGQGALTGLILAQNKEIFLECWEIDSEAIDYLNQTFLNSDVSNLPPFKLVERDALDFLKNRRAVDLEGKYVLISNLPYNVGSRILIELTLQEKKPTGLLIMLQKEVAKKLLPNQTSKNLNLLGTFLGLFWDFQLEVKVPAAAFSPQPKVESIFLSGYFNPKTTISAEKCLFLLKNLLKYPSKTIYNNLQNLGLTRPQAADFLQKINFQTTARLSKENFLLVLEALNSSDLVV